MPPRIRDRSRVQRRPAVRRREKTPVSTRTSFVLILLLADLVVGSPSYAQDHDNGGSAAATMTIQNVRAIRWRLPGNLDALSQSQFPQRPIVHHCCNRKGMIIGAAIGAGGGWLLTAFTCDAGDCTRNYIVAMASLGGVGAVAGAFADRNQAIPVAQPHRRVRVGG